MDAVQSANEIVSAAEARLSWSERAAYAYIAAQSKAMELRRSFPRWRKRAEAWWATADPVVKEGCLYLVVIALATLISRLGKH